MLRTARRGHRCRQWGVIGVGFIIVGGLLSTAPMARAAEQSQPGKSGALISAGKASSNDAEAATQVAQVIAQSDVQSRLDDLEKRMKALEQWVAKQLSMKKQHLEDESKLLNELGSF